MPLLSDQDRKFLQGHLKQEMVAPVKLLYFTQSLACQFCTETEQILQEVVELSDKITLEVKNFVTDKEAAEAYGIDKIPATLILGDGDKDHGVRFFGIPSGYEFTSLIEDIVDISKGSTNLSEETLQALARLPKPVHMQVFVTPT